MDLESRCAALQTELDTATPTSLSRRNQDPASWLPRAPPRHDLESHRSPVTCVAFHPIFSSLASGSEDTTIKIWDWELGELERTIKGHTRAVLDVDYGGPRGGTLLASCSSDLTIKLWDPADEYKTFAPYQAMITVCRPFDSSHQGPQGLRCPGICLYPPLVI
jgi:FOG: WD40 repeat